MARKAAGSGLVIDGWPDLLQKARRKGLQGKEAPSVSGRRLVVGSDITQDRGTQVEGGKAYATRRPKSIEALKNKRNTRGCLLQDDPVLIVRCQSVGQRVLIGLTSIAVPYSGMKVKEKGGIAKLNRGSWPMEGLFFPVSLKGNFLFRNCPGSCSWCLSTTTCLGYPPCNSSNSTIRESVKRRFLCGHPSNLRGMFGIGSTRLPIIRRLPVV